MTPPVCPCVARADEFEFLCALHAAAMRPHVERVYGAWDAAAQRARLRARTEPTTHEILERGGASIGCRWVRVHAAEWELVRLWVLPAYQGQGAGTWAVQCLLAQADDAGMPVRLRVLRGNRARDLYERCGFAVVDETANHFRVLCTRHL